MKTGIFRGIENGIASIEYQTTVSVNHRDGPDANGNWSDLVKATRIRKFEIAGKIHSVNWGFGYDAEKGWPYDAYPEVGREVAYEEETPDMAGHMVAWIGPVKDVA